MLAQWLLAAVHNVAGFGIGDHSLVPVSCAINDSLQVHPLASIAVEVIANFAFNVGFSLALPFCFVAQILVEFESVHQTNIVVRVAAGKVFRMSIGSGLIDDKRAGLAGLAGFWDGLGDH